MVSQYYLARYYLVVVCKGNLTGKKKELVLIKSFLVFLMYFFYRRM